MNALPRTFREAVAFFADSDTCRWYVAECRWPNGIQCPVCGSRRLYVDVSRDGWECRRRHPRRRFSLKKDTLFEGSRIGFEEWLPTIWMVANTSRPSSHAIARAIGVTQRTAWFMLLRMRLAAMDWQA
jgi:hypothetical protein